MSKMSTCNISSLYYPTGRAQDITLDPQELKKASDALRELQQKPLPPIDFAKIEMRIWARFLDRK